MSKIATKWDVSRKPLPRFNPKAVCPKCDHSEVSTYYRPAEDCGKDECFTCASEVLLRTCQRCRYQWAEKPEDQ